MGPLSRLQGEVRRGKGAGKAGVCSKAGLRDTVEGRGRHGQGISLERENCRGVLLIGPGGDIMVISRCFGC